MANIRSAKKHIIINRLHRLTNNSNKSKLKTYVKKFKLLIDTKQLIEAKLTFVIIQSILDKLSHKSIIHKNKGKRYKSKLMKLLNQSLT